MRLAPPAIEATALATVAAEDLAAAAGFLHDVRQGLLDDRSAPALRLFGGVPDAWLGQDLELHGLPTRSGRVSAALRWHGTRPALLWEVDRSPGDQPLALVAPRFDPGWSTSDRAGEALLAPVEPAGGLPAVVAPLAGPATQAADAPRGGESFA